MIVAFAKGLIEDAFGFAAAQFVWMISGTFTGVLNLTHKFEELHTCVTYSLLFIFASTTLCRMFRLAVRSLTHE
jgi:hypothetical protein